MRISAIEARSRKFLQHFVSDSGFHGFDRIRLDHNHISGETGETNVSFAVVANEIQGIFGFSGLGGNGIGIDDEGKVGAGNEFEDEPGKKSRGCICERQICQLIVNIAVKDDDIRVTSSALANLLAKIQGVGEIESETHQGNRP
jgi:hypothetical protein